MLGTKSEEVGFEIADANGNVLCQRTPGFAYDGEIIFCRFCIGCTVTYPNVLYQYTLGADGVADNTTDDTTTKPCKGKNCRRLLPPKNGGGGKNTVPDSVVGYNGTLLAFKQQAIFS